MEKRFYITEKKYQAFYQFRQWELELILDMLPQVPEDTDPMYPPENRWHYTDYANLKTGLKSILAMGQLRPLQKFEFGIFEIEDAGYLIYAFLDYVLEHKTVGMSVNQYELLDKFTDLHFERWHVYNTVTPFLKLSLPDESKKDISQIDIPVDEAALSLLQGALKGQNDLIIAHMNSEIERVEARARKYELLTCSLAFYEKLKQVIKRQLSEEEASMGKALSSFYGLIIGIEGLLKLEPQN